MAQADRETDETLNLFPANDDWSIQTLRLIAQELYGGAEFNEVYRAARSLTGDTPQAWAEGWRKLADKVAGEAAQAEASGHGISAKDAYFRAANYFRHAEFYLPKDDREKSTLYASARAAFRRGARLMDPPAEILSVPYADANLDGYLFAPAGARPDVPRPVVLFLGGADSTAEELLFFGGRAVLDRGAYLCAVDTPGRGSAIRLAGLPARPDYEVPVKAILDYLEGLPQIDAQKMGLLGVSMGGYYAPRAASFDKRVKALACWCACFDVFEDIYAFYPPIQTHLEWLTGAPDPETARRTLKTFTLEGVAQQITCPTLITHGESDFIIDPKAAQRLYDQLSGPKELRIWRASEGGGLHCGYDNFPGVVPFVVDWLLDHLQGA